MAQIIKNRRGSLDRLSSATGSLQKGEILIATGSSNLTGVTNGQGLVFAAVESGSIVAANRVLQGAVAPIFSGSTYGNLMDGVPFYASSSNTLFLLGADGNEAIDLSGNISDFSSSVSASFASLSQSVASVTGDFSSSVATSFSKSAYDLNALSASTYHAVFGFGELSSSIEQSISASTAKATADLNSYSASAATTDSASAASIAALSASVASVTGDFSSSVATSFSASAASQTALSSSVATTISNLSSSIATTDSASAAYAASELSNVSGAVATTISNLSSSVATSFSASAASQTELSSSLTSTINNVSGAFATSTSASNAAIASLSASVASVTGDFSSSVATSFSASAASQNNLSASIALTDNAQSDRLDVIESTYATTGSNTFVGTQTITGSLYITQNLVVYGSSSVQNVTASAVSIGTNTVVLNTANPAIRFGGIEVIDSGSSQATGSLLWDSENNVWLYANPVGSGYGSARLIAGPQNTGSLGQEIGLTTGYVPVAVGDDHIGDSIISASATKVNIEGGLDVTGELSASTINGIGNVTEFSSSVSASIASINNNLGGGGSLGGRVAGLESLTGSYATTGSNQFNGDQSVSGSVTVDTFVQTTTLQGTGSLYLKPDVNDSRQIEIYNTSPSDIHIKGINTAYTYLGDDTNYVLIDTNTNSVSITASAYVDIAGIGNVTNYSQSVDSRFSASAYDISSLSASVASVTGDFSSSVATSFSASNAQIAELSASVASTTGDFSSSVAGRLTTIETTYATTGSNVFHGDQVITGSFDMTGTANFNNAVAVNDSNMNLGNSSSLNLTGGSSIYVAGGGTISGSITGIGNVSAYSYSVDSRLGTIETSIGGGGSLGTRVANLEALTGSYATTGSNTFTDGQTIQGNIIIESNGQIRIESDTADTLFGMFDGNDILGAYYQMWGNNHASATQRGTAEFVFDTRNGGGEFRVVEYDGSTWTKRFIVDRNGNTQVTGSLFVSTEISSSTLNGIGNVTLYSQSVDSRFSSSAASVASLSASVASVTGDFSSSVATSFSASAASQTALSASIFGGSSLSQSLSGRVQTLENATGTYATTGSNTFIGNQTIGGTLTISGSSNYIAGYGGNTIYLNTKESSNLSGKWYSGSGDLVIQTDGTQGANVDILTTVPGNVNINASGDVNISTDKNVHGWSGIGNVHVTTSVVTIHNPYEIDNVAYLIVTGSISASQGFSGSINGIGNVSEFSSSVDSRLKSISGSYATTGSNTFIGNQHITGDVELTGSLYIQSGYDLSVNHIVGNNGFIEIGNIDNDLHVQATDGLYLVGSGSGVHIHNSNFGVAPNGSDVLVVSQSITKVTNEFSASNISGVGNIGEFSQSVDSRIQSLVSFDATASTALQFDGTNVTVLGNLTVQGTQTSVDSTIVNIGDNIISLNGTGGAYGGLVVKDPTAPNTASGSLLWDSTNDYWIAGASGSESKVLVAVGDNVVSSSVQIDITSTTGFSTFDTAISTSFSASNASISSLSASVASVTGDFSSSVATSFSASNASIASLSASVASVTGDFSSSVATSFSASAFNLNELSASIYQTDATQSVAINDNSSSFATSISASNFRITILETTIDGGSF